MELTWELAVQLGGYLIGVTALYLGLRHRMDVLARDKVDERECMKRHAAEDLRDARIEWLIEAFRAGHAGAVKAGTIKNPPGLPPVPDPADFSHRRRE